MKQLAFKEFIPITQVCPGTTTGKMVKKINRDGARTTIRNIGATHTLSMVRASQYKYRTLTAAIAQLSQQSRILNSPPAKTQRRRELVKNAKNLAMEITLLFHPV